MQEDIAQIELTEIAERVAGLEIKIKEFHEVLDKLKFLTNAGGSPKP
jgi:hypothetical protein